MGDGSPGVIRTPDQRFRKPLLYPSELRGHALILRHYTRAYCRRVPKSQRHRLGELYIGW